MTSRPHSDLNDDDITTEGAAEVPDADSSDSTDADSSDGTAL